MNSKEEKRMKSHICIASKITANGRFNLLMKMLCAATVTLAVLALVVLSPHNAAAQSANRRFTVVNNSHYTIDHIYVSPTDRIVWGRDRLGANYLLPGYRFDLWVVPDVYDILLIDHGNDSCVVSNVDLRHGDRWELTDEVLLACELVSPIQ